MNSLHQSIVSNGNSLSSRRRCLISLNCKNAAMISNPNKLSSLEKRCIQNSMKLPYIIANNSQNLFHKRSSTIASCKDNIGILFNSPTNPQKFIRSWLMRKRLLEEKYKTDKSKIKSEPNIFKYDPHIGAGSVQYISRCRDYCNSIRRHKFRLFANSLISQKISQNFAVQDNT
jgi:hypothetical protein